MYHYTVCYKFIRSVRNLLSPSFGQVQGRGKAFQTSAKAGESTQCHISKAIYCESQSVTVFCLVTAGFMDVAFRPQRLQRLLQI